MVGFGLLAASTTTVLTAGYAYFGVVAPWYAAIRDDASAVADAHWNHEVSHPGWSFPAKVWSAPAPLDLSPERIALHAEIRGYENVCPPVAPGQYCEKTGDVIPRGGQFAEGVQPPGLQGWTREPAFEPVLLGWLVGPDGELREHLPMDEAPDHLLAAIRIAEDENFENHPGVDFPGLARATWINVREGGFRQGASTLTMQLARNLTGKKERSIERKLAEIAQAVAMDQYLGKDRVMQMYLDAPYLGQTGTFSICGFETASRYYFGVSARDLTLAQAATLAAILPAPAKFAPDEFPERAKERRDRVLRRMGELGWDVSAALEEPVVASPHAIVPPERFPTYFAATRDALAEAVEPQIMYGAGLQVHTALDVVVQTETELVFTKRLPELERQTPGKGDGPLLGVAAVVDPVSGALVAAYDSAMVSSTGFNRVTQGRRQSGSAFKPIIYAMAFQPGGDGLPLFRANDVIGNTAVTFGEGEGKWTPRNANGAYNWRITLSAAFARSANVAAASLLQELGGPDPVIDFAATLGFDTVSFPHEFGLALGQAEVTPLEMSRFVGTVIHGGKRVSATPILQAIDADGTVVFGLEPPSYEALTPQSALLTRELMRLVVTAGTGRRARGWDGYQGDVVGKTGTTSDTKDLWFIGSTPTYSAALWVGYDTPSKVGDTAGHVAAPLFSWWADAVHTGLEPEVFPTEGITRHRVCAETGHEPNPTCPTIEAPILDGENVGGGCFNEHPPPPEPDVVPKKTLFGLLFGDGAADAR